ncbi:nitroreductase/quinone reductase family protein [Streptomyces monashensis]|uniref:nitroreductase/quinone reductase family protein n=1 Tax=Streptomyces monashensis TaxID=1678012 RepID=UPI0033C68E59
MSVLALRLRFRNRYGQRGRVIPHRTCLIYGTLGSEYVVVASKGGTENAPAWFMNLKADPSVGVRFGTHRFTTPPARVASSAERAALWSQMVKIFPLYEDYAQKTAREIPIVFLAPLDEQRQDLSGEGMPSYLGAVELTVCGSPRAVPPASGEPSRVGRFRCSRSVSRVRAAAR